MIQSYKKLPEGTGNILWDKFSAMINKGLFRKIVISYAKTRHEVTGRQYHVSEMFGAFIVFNGIDRDDINRSGKFGKMQVEDLLKASIWNTNQIKNKTHV